ncbi:MAG: protein tyrosine phosphatase family protein [Campylobacteraceae bacterium]|nr:protein tyrosine phosphatase family protein [Campylobacteraceae bacterium]
MENILNYIKINENIHTSAQPSVKDLENISKSFDIVINLALSTAPNSLENEDKIVSSFDMTYIHIPVSFENPKIKDLNLFINILKNNQDKKIWVHCAKNYRVSAFMYVYHKYILKTPFDDINLSMFKVWSPSIVWQELMKVEIK